MEPSVSLSLSTHHRTEWVGFRTLSPWTFLQHVCWPVFFCCYSVWFFCLSLCPATLGDNRDWKQCQKKNASLFLSGTWLKSSQLMNDKTATVYFILLIQWHHHVVESLHAQACPFLRNDLWDVSKLCGKN